MSDNLEIREVNGIDEVRFAPKGVCSKLMNLKIKDGSIISMETIGGCSGNLKGIGSLVLGMSVDDVIERLEGLACGSRTTSCPDQLSICLKMYKEAKAANVKVSAGAN